MEENVLIKSQLLKDKFKKWYITWTIIAISFLFLSLLINYPAAKEMLSLRRYAFLTKIILLLGYTDFGLILSIVSGVALLTIIVTSIIHLALSKCSLVVTAKNVKGRALWGKQVVLPIHMIAAYSTRQLFSTIAITTTSGVIKFGLIKNYKEIGEVLSTLINQRQENTEVAQATPIITQQQTSNLDELKKLKELLDMGIISQEEFDVKKKQLLGL